MKTAGFVWLAACTVLPTLVIHAAMNREENRATQPKGRSAVLNGGGQAPGNAVAKTQPQSQPSETIDRLRRYLRIPPAHTHGGLDGATGPARDAIDKLRALGSSQAVEALQEFLTRPDADRRLKIQALIALGQIGTKDAVRAIEAFEKWAESRRTQQDWFRFARHDYPIPHTSPHSLPRLAQATDTKGGRWAMFWWTRIGGGDQLWLTQQLVKDTWSDPVPVPIALPVLPPGYPSPTGKPQEMELKVAGGKVSLVVDGKTFSFLVTDARKDTDSDGLPDSFEAMLGTNPTKKDSDADSVCDNADPCPLTPRGKKAATGDVAEIRQAVLSCFLATSNSRDIVFMVDRGRPQDAFARQEYYGFSGYLLPTSEPRRGCVNIVDLSVKLTSPTTATAQIADWEAELSAAGWSADLKKVHGKWIVTSLKLTGIS